MEKIILVITEYIHFPVLITIVVAGVFVTKYTNKIAFIHKRYKVLITSVVISVIFYLAEDCNADCLIKYIFTYFLTTSFYELIIKYVKKKINEKNIIRFKLLSLLRLWPIR